MKLTPAHIKEIKEYHQKGLSLRKIAKIFGVSHQAIHKQLRKESK